MSVLKKTVYRIEVKPAGLYAALYLPNEDEFLTQERSEADAVEAEFKRLYTGENPKWVFWQVVRSEFPQTIERSGQ